MESKDETWRYQEKLQHKVQPAAFPTAQSITAEAVLADKAQTCQPSTEELLLADNYHREQSTVRTGSSNRGSYELFACCLRSNCRKRAGGSAFVGTCA